MESLTSKSIEQLTQTIEYALVEQQIVEKLQLGNQVLKQIHQEMDLEKVERIMDDTADGIAYQKEIEETMTRDFTPEDEEEIMRELDRLVDLEVCHDHSCLRMPRPHLIQMYSCM